MKQPAFYIDMTACCGCKTCMVSCLDGHDAPLGVLRRRVIEYTGGSWVEEGSETFSHNVFSYYLSLSCNHCKDPACIKVCPTGALFKDEQGIVRVSQETCMGCRYCEYECPYSAPQYNEETQKINKCDCCKERLDVGLEPLCVESCPMRALSFGEYDKLIKEFGNATHIAPLPVEDKTSPCLIITPPHNAKPCNSKEGKVSNSNEI